MRQPASPLRARATPERTGIYSLRAGDTGALDAEQERAVSRRQEGLGVLPVAAAVVPAGRNHWVISAKREETRERRLAHPDRRFRSRPHHPPADPPRRQAGLTSPLRRAEAAHAPVTHSNSHIPAIAAKNHSVYLLMPRTTPRAVASVTGGRYAGVTSRCSPRRDIPPARSTAPTPAASRSRSRTAASPSSTAADATRSPRASSAPRCAASREHLYGPERAAASRRSASGDKGEGRVRARLAGTRRSTCVAGAMRRVARALGRRGDPAVLLRRLERLPHPGHDRRPRSSAASAPRAWRARSAPRRPARAADRPLRQDAGRRARRLRARAADRALGRQPVGSGHPPRAATSQRRAAARRAARGRRSAAHAARRAGRPPPGAAARHRPAAGARGHPLALRRTGAPTRASSAAHATGAERAARARRAAGRSSAPPRRAGVAAGRHRALRRALRRRRARR